MIFKKGELRLLWPFYLHALIHGLSFLILPFIIIYFRDLGFSYLQIYIITFAYNISMFVFEVPTGAFADGFSRKYSAILGFTIAGIAAFMIAVFTNFFILLLLWAIIGLGMTFVSGAQDAWVVDNLHAHKRNDLRKEFFIKNMSIMSIGVIVAPLIGAFIAGLSSIRVLWYFLSAGLILGALVLAAFAEEKYKPKRMKIKEAFKKTYQNSRKGLKFVRTHKTVFLLVIGIGFLALSLSPNDGWQPLLVNLGLEKYALGIVFSIAGAVMMISPFLTHLFKNWKVKNALAAIITFEMIALLCLLFLTPPMFIPAIFIFLVTYFTEGLSHPLFEEYFHRFIPKKIRATVVSVKRMVFQLVVGVGGLIAGALMDVFGPKRVIAFGALFAIGGIVMFLKIED